MNAPLTRKVLILLSLQLLFAYTISFAQFNDIRALFTGITDGKGIWGDYDNDGDLDVLIIGDEASKIYRNKGDGSFEDSGIDNLTAVNNGAAAWGDYDNDGNLDIVLIGNNSSNLVLEIYRNNNGNTFNKVDVGTFTPLDDGAVAWGDYDNDGDLDLLTCGYDGTNSITKIYKNNQGNFTDSGVVNIQMGLFGDAAWGDYDNDGWLDILIAAQDNTNDDQALTKIFRNQGDGTFIDSNIDLLGVEQGAVAWGDYDNDGDLDFVVTGLSDNRGLVSLVYQNTGNGNFNESKVNNLLPVKSSSVSWGDYDNDGDLDILLTGLNSLSDNGTRITQIYDNNGDGTFTKNGFDGLPGVKDGSIAWGDYDKDGDLDILVVGSGNTDVPVTKVYRNFMSKPNNRPNIPNGLNAEVTNTTVALSWNRSSDQETPSQSLSYNIYIGTSPDAVDIIQPAAFTNPAKVTFSDQKLVKLGNLQYQTRLKFDLKSTAETYYWSVQAVDQGYLGSYFAPLGTFEIQDEPIAPTGLSATETSGQINLSWTDNIDNESGFVIQRSTTSDENGFNTIDTVSANTTNYQEDNTLLNNNTTYYYRIRAYNTRGNSPFSNVANAASSFRLFNPKNSTDITPALDSDIQWGDVDNDGDLDIVLSGFSPAPNSTYITEVFINQGNGQFAKKNNPSLIGLSDGSIDLGDYDNDGDLDILITGSVTLTSVPSTKIYNNNGNGTFEDSKIDNITKVSQGTAIWGDYDNDGDLDILITGTQGNLKPATKIFQNKGNGSFEDSGIDNLTPMRFSNAAWGDYDNDGDLDIALIGWDMNENDCTKIFRNKGDGTFEDSNLNLTGANAGGVAWGDYNKDGFLDLLITGAGSTKVYKNEGGNNFTDSGNSFVPVHNSTAQWGDYDNDGNLDILVAGSDQDDYENENAILKIYRNKGDNTFEDINTDITAVNRGGTVWGDFDNDGDLDIVIAGKTSGNAAFSRIYRSEITTPNTLPATPTDLKAVVKNDTVTLTWDKSTDLQTDQNSLTYNLRIGTAPGKSNLLSSMAITGTGFRKVIKRGLQNNFKVLKGIKPKIYYWSVQAIDQSFAGSVFATEGQFRVVTPPSIPQDLKALPWSISSIRLIWSSKSNADNFASYIIERSDGDESNFMPIDTLTSDVTEYENTGLSQGINYFYRIQVINTAGSGTSNITSGKTNNLPQAPKNLRAIASNTKNEITLSWQDVAINEQGFIIERKSLLSPNLDYIFVDSIKSTNQTTYLDKIGLVGNVKYTYRVRSYNASGQSANSEEVSATTPFNTSKNLPQKPLNLEAYLSSTSQISVEWTYTDTSIHSFIIQRSSKEDSTNYQQIAEIPGKTLREYHDTTGLAENETYHYRLFAKNERGLSTTSNIATARTICDLSFSLTLAKGHTLVICNGQGAKLQIDEDLANATYQWQRDGIDIENANTQFYIAYIRGEYSCKVTLGNCTQISKNNIEILETEPPTVSISQFIQDSALFLEASITDADTYYWYINNQLVATTEDHIFKPATSGVYHLAIEIDACTATSNTITGIDALDLTGSMTVSPNPTFNEVEFSLTTPIQGNYEIWLINTQGQRFKLSEGTKQQANLKKRLQLKDFTAGVYQIQLKLGKYRGTKKLIKY